MNSGKLLGRVIARNIVARRTYGGGQHLKAPTMNDLPVPQGDFFQLAAARERGHNKVFALGLALFSLTCYITYESKIIHVNYSPPETYE